MTDRGSAALDRASTAGRYQVVPLAGLELGAGAGLDGAGVADELEESEELDVEAGVAEPEEPEELSPSDLAGLLAEPPEPRLSVL
jgi:hypothetical protein